MRINAETRGLADIIRQLGGTEAEVNRAARNAINVINTRTHKEVAKTIAKETSLISPTPTRKAIEKFQARQGELIARLVPSDKPLPIVAPGQKSRKLAYKARIQRTRYPTRRTVLADLTLQRQFERVPRAFLNPKGRQKKVLQRPAGVGRYPVRVPTGPSIADQFSDLIDQSYTRIIADNLLDTFRQKLDDQIRRRR